MALWIKIKINSDRVDDSFGDRLHADSAAPLHF